MSMAIETGAMQLLLAREHYMNCGMTSVSAFRGAVEQKTPLQAHVFGVQPLRPGRRQKDEDKAFPYSSCRPSDCTLIRGAKCMVRLHSPKVFLNIRA